MPHPRPAAPRFPGTVPAPGPTPAPQHDRRPGGRRPPSPRASGRLLSLTLLLMAPTGGCLGADPIDEATTPADAGPPADLRVLDGFGRARDFDGVPRRPVLELRGIDSDAPHGLFEGPLDDALLDAVGRGRLSLALEARRLGGIAADPPGPDAVVRIQPRGPLPAGAGLAVVARERATGTPRGWSLRVGGGVDAGGARPVASWPADGTAGAPATLPLLAVRFDGAVAMASGRPSPEDDRLLVLAEAAPSGPVADRRQVPSKEGRLPCDELGWGPNGHCRVLVPTAPLAPARRYELTLAAGVVDGAGAPLEPWTARFAVTEGEGAPASLVALPCFVDEDADRFPGCVLADDDRVTLRFRASAPVRASLRSVDGSVLDAAVAPRGEATLSVSGLGPDASLNADLALVDLAGRRSRYALQLHTTPPLPKLTIAEVLADPRGPEPAQEWVELWNAGAAPAPLAGVRLADDPGKEGDLVGGPGEVLAPDARALVVGSGFDPHLPTDPPIPPGVPLLRVEGPLASGGLSNGGEALFLRSSDGVRLSAAPAEPTLGPGRCLRRVDDADLRTGAPEAFTWTPEGGCTPGEPNVRDP